MISRWKGPVGSSRSNVFGSPKVVVPDAVKVWQTRTNSATVGSSLPVSCATWRVVFLHSVTHHDSSA